MPLTNYDDISRLPKVNRLYYSHYNIAYLLIQITTLKWLNKNVNSKFLKIYFRLY